MNSTFHVSRQGSPPPPSEDIEALLQKHQIEKPRGWDSFTQTEKLDHIATRMLANSRGWTRGPNKEGAVTSHSQMKEEGYLSQSQMERRLEREVYSNRGDLDSLRPTPGVFSRKLGRRK